MAGPDKARDDQHPAPTLAALPSQICHLPPALRAVARELLADPETFAHASAAALARRAGTGTGTVLRLARALGHPTFSAMQWAVRREHNRMTAPPPSANPWRRT